MAGHNDINISRQQESSTQEEPPAIGVTSFLSHDPESSAQGDQQANSTTATQKESPDTELSTPPVNLNGEQQPAEAGQVEVAEPDSQVSNSTIPLEPSIYHPPITLSQAPTSNNKVLRRFTRYVGGVRSETGELRSGLTLPITKKPLKRAMDREHRRAELPVTPALCRKTDEEESVSSLELDRVEFPGKAQQAAVVAFVSKDWAIGGA